MRYLFVSVITTWLLSSALGASDPFKDVQVPAVVDPLSKNNSIFFSIAGRHVNLELCDSDQVPGVSVSLTVQQSRNEVESGKPTRIWDFVGVLNVDESAPSNFNLIWCTSDLQATTVWQRSTPVSIRN